MNNGIKIGLAVLGVGAAGAAGYYFFKMSGGSAHLKYVPKESAFVAMVNPKSLWTKVDYPRLKKMKAYDEFKKMLEKDDDLQIFNEIIEKPEESGLGLLSNMYMFGTMKNESMESGGMVMEVKNAEDFEKLVRKIDTKGGIEKDETYKHVVIDDEVILGWNKEAAVLLFNDDEDAVEKSLDNVMVQQKDESILAEPKFDAFRKNSSDAGIWVNYGEIIKMVGSNEVMDIAKDMGLEDAAMDVTLNFDNDKVVLKSEIAYSEENKDNQIDIFNEKGVSEEHLKTVSDDNVFGIVSASFNMKNLFEAMNKNKDMRQGLVDMRESLGLSKDDLMNLFTGEVTLSITDLASLFESQEEEMMDLMDTAAAAPAYDPYSSNQGNRSIYSTVQYYDDGTYEQEIAPDYGYSDEGAYDPYMDPEYMPMYQPRPTPLPGMILSLSSKQPESIERIFKKQELPKDADGLYALQMGGYTVYAVITKHGLTVTNNHETAKTLAKKREFKVPNGDYKEVVTSSSAAMFLDLDLSHYPKKVMSKMEENMGKSQYNSFKDKMKSFKSFVIASNVSKSEAMLNMTEDKKQSSLMRIIEMIDEAATE